MSDRETRRRHPEYEPYDDYYQVSRRRSETEIIDDSTMDPDLIEHPFGRIYTERRLVDTIHPTSNRRIPLREPQYYRRLRRGNR